MIEEPLVPPVRASRYRDGGCFSFLITHPGGSLLIHPNANYMVDATRPGLIMPIHWDDFFVSLDSGLRPLPRFFDRFAVARAFLDPKSRESGIAVRFPEPFEVIRPFVR
ncbi:hypothetical protein O7622_19500 [Micromonospora sp. WMMD1076]|uniref:hypothetical protein n=1 Tax=Micromonospora sp. WMMD1076 TaxID=3016103 RepID=UPI00249C4EA8|nr:hypothetical protein [Micromonospora sp. WMMD1076]WFF05239.1 hypothetical protein O7622_19500 [Micromonospora sp. WMMD1076]